MASIVVRHPETNDISMKLLGYEEGFIGISAVVVAELRAKHVGSIYATHNLLRYGCMRLRSVS